MTEDWIGGDGGPLVVLQGGAVAAWRGAADFALSKMNGGPLETDYDVACAAKAHQAHRHDRALLVLDDSSWSGRIRVAPSGVVVVEQPYFDQDEPWDVLAGCAAATPIATFPLDVRDDRLRLLVAADGGQGQNYGSMEVPIQPGAWRCDAYRFDHGLYLILTPP